jgi:hypothetical protein
VVSADHVFRDEQLVAALDSTGFDLRTKGKPSKTSPAV